MAASESEIDDAIRKRAHTFREEAETITMRIVRRLLEEDLGLTEGSLEPQKKYISKAVDRVLNESTGKNGIRSGGEDVKPQGTAETGKDGKEVVQREATKTKEEPLRGQKDQDGAKSEEEEGSEEEPAAVKDSEDEEEEEETHKRSKSGKGQRSVKERDRRKMKPESDGEEEAAEESEEAAESAEESEQEEEVVVRKRSKQRDKPGKSKRRRKREPQSDQEDSEGASGSSEEDEQPAKKRRRKADSSSEEDVESDGEPSHKRKDRTEKGKDKVRSQSAQAAYLNSNRVVELKAILKQCGITIGPSVYKKAKDSKDPEAVLVRGLKDLLEKEGLSSNPSDKEIKRVKKRLQTQKELEGIDTGNIIEESGRGSRRAAREAAAKVPQYIEGSDSDEDGSGQASDEEEEDDDEAFSEGNDDEGDED